MLQGFRPALEPVRAALGDERSPHVLLLDAVCAALPPLSAREDLRRLAADGPPGDLVGLEPFAPPEAMPACGASAASSSHGPHTGAGLRTAGFVVIAAVIARPAPLPQYQGRRHRHRRSSRRLGGFFPPLAMRIVKDAAGDYVMGFVFLVAFAWMCAGQALVMIPGERDPAAPRQRPGGRTCAPERARSA